MPSVSLLDIAPPELAAKEITVRGKALALRGIPAIGWAQLYAAHPVLRKVASGKPLTGESTLDVVAAESALIAAALGHLGNRAVERGALTNLTAEERQELVGAAIALSYPGDVFGPLLDAAAEAA